jgi:nucleotide-binding universal stress UspA family protein
VRGSSSRTDIVHPQTEYLSLDRLAADPRLAQRLPPDLAYRFHALPVAEDEGRLTVVMANPDDPVAREAVVSALGSVSCLVQGDLAAIDSALEEIWGYEGPTVLNLVVCDFPNRVGDSVWSYAEALGELLEARVRRVNTSQEIVELAYGEVPAEHELILFEDAEHPSFRRLLSAGNHPSPKANHTATARQNPVAPKFGLPLALLAARQPRWPLKKILLVLCGEERDSAAVAWTVFLARRSGSAVTILAMVPPVPATVGQCSATHQGLPALLSNDTPLGWQVRRAARHLADWEVKGSLRLRQGPPDWQIRREIAEGDYDLIVVAATRCPRWLHWQTRVSLGLGQNLLGHILHWADRPVLVACAHTA